MGIKKGQNISNVFYGQPLKAYCPNDIYTVHNILDATKVSLPPPFNNIVSNPLSEQVWTCSSLIIKERCSGESCEEIETWGGSRLESKDADTTSFAEKRSVHEKFIHIQNLDLSIYCPKPNVFAYWQSFNR